MKRKQLKKIKRMAIESAGTPKKWITKHERKAYIKGYMQGIIEFVFETISFPKAKRVLTKNK